MDNIVSNKNNKRFSLSLYPIKLTFSILGIFLFILSIHLSLPNIFIINNVEAHKLLESPHNNNSRFESALTLPNHTVSWVMYQQLGQDNVEARFYKFDNKQINSSFYV